MAMKWYSTLLRADISFFSEWLDFIFFKVFCKRIKSSQARVARLWVGNHSTRSKISFNYRSINERSVPIKRENTLQCYNNWTGSALKTAEDKARYKCLKQLMIKFQTQEEKQIVLYCPGSHKRVQLTRVIQIDRNLTQIFILPFLPHCFMELNCTENSIFLVLYAIVVCCFNKNVQDVHFFFFFK